MRKTGWMKRQIAFQWITYTGLVEAALQLPNIILMWVFREKWSSKTKSDWNMRAVQKVRSIRPMSDVRDVILESNFLTPSVDWVVVADSLIKQCPSYLTHWVIKICAIKYCTICSYCIVIHHQVIRYMTRSSLEKLYSHFKNYLVLNR